jgi:PhnB protein
MNVKPIPDGFHAVTPYLRVRDVARQIEFMTKAFGGEVIERIDSPMGTMHAEVKIRDSIIMMGQVPGDQKPMPVTLYLYVENADKVYAEALKLGATSVQEMKDQFYGDRSGAVRDSNDNEWWIATRKENLTHDELATRARQAHQVAVGK